MTTRADPLAVERISSSIAGLDVILGGGFFRSGVYIVQGLPGCGKTILANQVCYGHVRNGGAAVYVTLLAESHARMIQHLSTLSFFDVGAFPDKLAYISAFHDLEAGGLKGLMTVLRREMRSRDAGILVLDGLVAASEAAPSDLDLKKFVHELQSISALSGCTVLLLTSGSVHRLHAEHTMVDGLIELEDKLFQERSERSIQVVKFRGAAALAGRHAFRIDDGGIRVFPRTEAIHGGPVIDGQSAGSTTSGSLSLDALMESGGIPRASATVVIGSTGTGKTTMGLQFLHGSSAAEPGLHLSFFESPDRLRMKARSLDLALEPLEAAGHAELMWQTPGETLLDELAEKVLVAVARRQVRRLVLDGLSGFVESAVYPDRITRFFSALINELRTRRVTTMMTIETRDVVSSIVSLPLGISGFVDNLFFLRFVHEQGTVERLLTILKMRDTDYAAGLHRIVIGPHGIRLAGTLSSGGDVIPKATPVDTPGA